MLNPTEAIRQLKNAKQWLEFHKQRHDEAKAVLTELQGNGELQEFSEPDGDGYCFPEFGIRVVFTTSEVWRPDDRYQQAIRDLKDESKAEGKGKPDYVKRLLTYELKEEASE